MGRHAAERAPVFQRAEDHPVKRRSTAAPINPWDLAVILGRTHAMQAAPRYVPPWRRWLAHHLAELWPVIAIVCVLVACALVAIWCAAILAGAG